MCGGTSIWVLGLMGRDGEREDAVRRDEVLRKCAGYSEISGLLKYGWYA